MSVIAGPLKPTTLPTGFKLFKRAIRQYFHDWKRYIKLLAIISVPSNLMSLIPSLRQDNFVNSYLAFAAIIMNVALVWAIARKHEEGSLPSVGRAYYDGSALLVRYLLVIIMIVGLLVPASLGIIVIGTTIITATQGLGGGAELALLSVIGLALAVPTFWGLVRFVLAPVASARDHLRPLAAMRAARVLTLGNFWAVTRRLIALVWWLAVISLPVTLVAALLSYFGHDTAALLLLQISITFTALPFTNLYLFELYIELENSFLKRHPETQVDGPDQTVVQELADEQADGDPLTTEVDASAEPSTNAAPETEVAPRRIDMVGPRTNRQRYQMAFGESIERRRR